MQEEQKTNPGPDVESTVVEGYEEEAAAGEPVPADDAEAIRRHRGGGLLFFTSVMGLSVGFVSALVLSGLLQVGGAAWLVWWVPPAPRMSIEDRLKDRFVQLLVQPEEEKPEPPPEEEKEEPEPILPPEPVAREEKEEPEPEPEPVEEEAAVVEESPAVEEAPTGFAVQGIGGGDGGGGPTITTGSGSVKGPIATGRPGRKGGTGEADAADAKPRKIASRPKNMGETGSPPKPIKAPKPKYPKYFAQKAIAGRVVVECIIDQQGRIADCRRKSGHEELAKFLIHFLKNEHMYEPARDADGRPRRYKKVFSQDFKLT